MKIKNGLKLVKIIVKIDDSHSPQFKSRAMY